MPSPLRDDMPGPLTLGEIAARLGDRLLGGAGVLIEQAGGR